MTYETWDFENDVIETKSSLLFPKNTAQNYMGSAYAVETSQGIFYQKPRSSFGMKYDLMLVNSSGESVYEKDIVVVASDMNYTCIIVHLEETGEYILIDTRGIFYLLGMSIEKTAPAMYSMYFDRSSGFYSVGDRNNTKWIIRAVSKKKQFQIMMDSAEDWQS